MKKKLTLINWGFVLVFYLLFSIWHGAFEGRLTPEEIDVFVDKYQTLNPEKDTKRIRLNPEKDTKRIRALMESDDGKPKYMVNAIKLYDSPQLINGKKAGETSAEILDTYTQHVFSFLLRHGSYPIYSGNAVFDAVERWGVTNADEWTSGAIVRYRSMRVMMKMSTDPSFRQFHDYKIAAMEKTIAFPTTAVLNLGSLSLIMTFVFIIFGLIAQLIINNKMA